MPTPTERYLKKLCDNSFLSLWSYLSVYRDQTSGGNATEGKEICDLLVVFGNHILIFSDKYCQFPSTGDLNRDWSRWFKRAIEKSADQIWGAERWIKSYPSRIFLDKECSKPFPVKLPEPSNCKIHRIIVAHGASARCRAEFGGSGSLMIMSNEIGDIRPFAVGQIDPTKGFVHVFDDTTLDLVMQTLDTISDFVSYLSKKEELVEHKIIVSPGEEELLALYLGNINEHDQHDFNISDEFDLVALEEGFWEDFVGSPERKRQQLADEISYSWDKLIEKFAFHFRNDTQYHPSGSFDNIEISLRFMAREPRTRRRMLARSLIDAIYNTQGTYTRKRVIAPSHEGDPYFVFLVFPHFDDLPYTSDYSEYRDVRQEHLYQCCLVTKLRCPDAKDIVGIATEAGGNSKTISEDLLYIDAREWTNEQQIEALKIQRDLGLLQNVEMFHYREYEYPSLPISTPQKISRKIGRNSKCPCGSGKKYKHCCLRRDQSRMRSRYNN